MPTQRRRRRLLAAQSSGKAASRPKRRRRGELSGIWRSGWPRRAAIGLGFLVASLWLITFTLAAMSSGRRCAAPTPPTSAWGRMRNVLLASPDAFSSALCRPPPVAVNDAEQSGRRRRPPHVALALAVSTRAFMRHTEPTAYELSNVVIQSRPLVLPDGFEARMLSGVPLAPEPRRAIRRRSPRAPALHAARRRVAAMPFFSSLLPSFARTASSGYNYTFSIVLDHDDPLVEELGGSEKQAQSLLRARFAEVLAAHAGSGNSLTPSPRLVVRVAAADAEGGQPARRQNEAVLRAYLEEGADYVLRVNDDTQLLTCWWVELLIGALQQQGNLGVVGPTCLDGNQEIMTHEMTHVTHLALFARGGGGAHLHCCSSTAHREALQLQTKLQTTLQHKEVADTAAAVFYYPANFTAWYADEWIDRVYRPFGLSRRLASVRVAHQWHPQIGGASSGGEWRVWTVLRDLLRGRAWHKPKSRYYGAAADADIVRGILPAGWRTVARALHGAGACRRIIAMSIAPSLPRAKRIAHAHAVARNAVVMSRLMPGWTLRVYLRLSATPRESVLRLSRAGVEIWPMERLFNARRLREKKNPIGRGKHGNEKNEVGEIGNGFEWPGDDALRGQQAERIFDILDGPGAVVVDCALAADLWHVAMPASDLSVSALLFRDVEWSATPDEATAVRTWHERTAGTSSWLWRGGRLVGVKRGSGALDRFGAVVTVAEQMLRVGAGGPCEAEAPAVLHPLQSIERTLIRKHSASGGWVCTEAWQCAAAQHS